VRCLKDYGLSPNPPSDPSPADGDSAVFASVVLGWSCNDPDGDSLIYDLYFGTDNPPAVKVDSFLTSASRSYSNLLDRTTYYWRIVANDGHGNALATGPVWSFTTGGPFGQPCPGTPTVDYAGKMYNTVLVGNQCWLKENLDVGALILSVNGATDNDTIEKYCYGDDPANCARYGGLYQWTEAMQYATAPGGQGICPPGWHIPTLAEYDVLGQTVNHDGNALKAAGQGSGGGAGTNTSGFSAMLAGYRYYLGYTTLLGTGYYWSSTESAAANANYLGLAGYNESIYLGSSIDGVREARKDEGFSLRCLQD
jgi:uncharacterized protein (TIGR02145 family)